MPIDFSLLTPDLVVPPLMDSAPAAGRRVRCVLPEHAGSALFHTLHLPTSWRPDRRWPLIVEYPGNGPHLSACGDRSTGLQEDAAIGFGLAGPDSAIWAVLPCVDPVARAHARQWWGDADATTAYCRAAVADLVARFAADPHRIVLCGFSRGGIACGYLGLRDRATAALWRGFVASSHYDGVRAWRYAGDDRAAALERLRRLAGRPQFICHEQPEGTAATRALLAEARETTAATFLDLPWRNHSGQWTLYDVPERKRLRRWWRDVVESETAGE